MPVPYPFSAVLGCESDGLDDMGLALVLTTIAPEIGGVLVRGEKGTAKSTTVRGLAAVLPPIEVYAGDRFGIDPTDPAATSPDGPFAADAETVTRPVTSTISVGAISKSDNRIGCSASSSTYVSAMSADLRRGAAAPACAHGRMCDLGRLRLVSRLSHSTVPTPGLPRFITKTPMSTTVAYFRPSFLAYLWDRRRQPQQNR